MDREQRSLLVIDGSASYIFFVAMMLKKLEYAVRTASSAEEALHAMTDSPPALVITETVLPKMSGAVLLQTMKRHPRLMTIPVIIHTSQPDPALRETCLRAGCADYFMKPVEPDVLYRAIQAATEVVPRKMIRIDTSLAVRIGNVSAPAGACRTEEVTTISEGGLYIRSLVPEPAQTVLQLVIFLDNKQIRATAVVLISSAKIGGPHKVPGMGLKFVSISPQDKALIGDFIKRQITKDLAPAKA